MNFKFCGQVNCTLHEEVFTLVAVYWLGKLDSTG